MGLNFHGERWTINKNPSKQERDITEDDRCYGGKQSRTILETESMGERAGHNLSGAGVREQVRFD